MVKVRRSDTGNWYECKMCYKNNKMAQPGGALLVFYSSEMFRTNVLT
jgi:hypothetical protein